MKIDLLHNKIVRDTITEKFSESFAENVIPPLFSRYGESLVGVQMYEDYISDGFSYNTWIYEVVFKLLEYDYKDQKPYSL